MKKFEQVKQLHKTMLAEYAKHSNSKAFLSGITSDFDRLFELCWKTLKEYLQKEKCIEAAKTGSPKDILKLAYQQGLINDEDLWLRMLTDRNDDAHHYNESSARSYAARIEREYLEKVDCFIGEMSKLIQEEKDVLMSIPNDFLMAVDLSGMYYDEFLSKVMQENGCKSDLEIFEKWETIKANYVENLGK